PRVVHPDGTTGLEWREGELLPVTRDQMEPRRDVVGELVIARRRALEHAHAADVHVRGLVLLSEEAGVCRAEPVEVGNRHRVTRFLIAWPGWAKLNLGVQAWVQGDSSGRAGRGGSAGLDGLRQSKIRKTGSERAGPIVSICVSRPAVDETRVGPLIGTQTRVSTATPSPTG